MTEQIERPIQSTDRPVVPSVDSGIKIQLKWLRGKQRINFKEASTWWTFGKRFSGKSSLMETIASRYLDNGATVFDIFSARDGESLAWCRSPYQDIMLLCGDSVSLKTDYAWSKISDFTLREGEKHQLVITTPQLYGTEYEQYAALSKLTDMLKWRSIWKKIDVLLVREASRLIASRIISGKVSNRMEAEYDFIDLHNESYHTGVACCIDSLRPISIAPDVREVANYLFIKKLGRMRLPRELSYIFKFVNVSTLRNMAISEFLMITDSDKIAGGRFSKVPWHITRGENLMHNLKIEVTRDVGKAKEVETQDQLRKKGKLEPVKVESWENARRPRKITKEIHNHIIKQRGDGKTTPVIRKEILDQFKTSLSVRIVHQELSDHRLGTCKCNTGA